MRWSRPVPDMPARTPIESGSPGESQMLTVAQNEPVRVRAAAAGTATTSRAERTRAATRGTLHVELPRLAGGVMDPGLATATGAESFGSIARPHARCRPGERFCGPPGSD